MTVTAERQLLDRVLRPYRDNCKYLEHAELDAAGGTVRATGRFAIPESCYIDDTGHFNAVEFNICYNQLGYYLIAQCVAGTLFPEFAGWSLDDYWDRQLSDVLIYRFSSRFKRMIDSRAFSGEVVFQRPVIRTRPGGDSTMFMDTTCAFRDDNGGAASGEVGLAFVRLPVSAVRAEEQRV